MKAKIYMVSAVVVALFAISVHAYADDQSGTSQGGPMLGGSGHGGGMGGHGGMGGGGMMAPGQGLTALWEALSKKLGERDPDNKYQETETEALRKQIREKRQELSDLLGSDKPDKERLDEKIDELNRLESELDQKTSALGPRR
jgi:Spy/CpxP family protein refolding chaperone